MFKVNNGKVESFKDKISKVQTFDRFYTVFSFNGAYWSAIENRIGRISIK